MRRAQAQNEMKEAAKARSDGFEPARSRVEPGGPLPVQARFLLSLQSAAGNRAVAGLVQRSREEAGDAGLGQRVFPVRRDSGNAERPSQAPSAPVQRHDPEDEELQTSEPRSPAGQLQPERVRLSNETGIPDNLKASVESLSGVSLDNVQVHYNSPQPPQLNALAYAQGSDIHVAPGQEPHLPHEAWHVVQQTQGRVTPTMQMKDGVPVNDDEGLEHEADVMGARAAVVGHRSAQQDAGPRTPPLISSSPTPSQGPVQLAKGDARKARDRATQLRTEWTALGQEADQLRARVVAAGNNFNYGGVLPAALIAAWRTVPAIETRLADVGGDIYLVKTGAGRPNIVNHANLPLGAQAMVADGIAHRAQIAGLHQELATHTPRVVELENQAVAWLATAGRLAPAFNAALQVRAETAPISAAVGRGEPAAKIRNKLALLNGQWLGLAELILAAEPNEALILGRLTNWTAKHYEGIGLTSGKMMELNKDAGAVATAVLGALTSGGKVSTSPIAAVYRSEPFDDPADRFSISWRLQLTNPTPQERQTLTWMTSWEMHAHCQLLRVPGPGPSGFTMTPGAAHVKPTVRQRELGVSITVPQAFMTALENASQADFVGWLHNNPTRVTGALSNFAAK